MNDHIVVKAGSEKSDPLTDVNFLIPRCLGRMREDCTGFEVGIQKPTWAHFPHIGHSFKSRHS